MGTAQESQTAEQDNRSRPVYVVSNGDSSFGRKKPVSEYGLKRVLIQRHATVPYV